MPARSVTAARKPRADSLRNRERLLQAATRVFSAGGPDASLDAIAKRAGVGIGTLYRHFPTREALFEAVYRHEVDEIAALADRLAREDAPLDALRHWLDAFVQLIARKKGMLAALSLAAHAPPELYAYSFEHLTKAVGLVLQRAVAARQVRADVTPEDLLRAILGLSHSYEGPDWQKAVTRLVAVFVDGLIVKRTSG